MFLNSNAGKVMIKPYAHCSRSSQLQLYASISPGVYTVLLQNFARQDAAEEVLVKVFVDLFNNISNCSSADDVEVMAHQIASRFIASHPAACLQRHG